MSVFFKRRGQYNSLIKKISNYAIGDSIFLKVNNTLEEFIIIRQVNPDSKYYDKTFNGTWIMKKNPILNINFNNINNYLNETFLNSLENNLIKEIKTVNLPYGNLNTETKCFIPSISELDANYSLDGSKLYCNISFFDQWTRTIVDNQAIALINNAPVYIDDLTQNYNIYPIFLLPYDTLIFKSNNTFAGGQ